MYAPTQHLRPTCSLKVRWHLLYHRPSIRSVRTPNLLWISPGASDPVQGQDWAYRHCSSPRNILIWRSNLPVFELFGRTLCPSAWAVTKKERQTEPCWGQIRYSFWDDAVSGRSRISVPGYLVPNSLTTLRDSHYVYFSRGGKQRFNIVCEYAYAFNSPQALYGWDQCGRGCCESWEDGLIREKHYLFIKTQRELFPLGSLCCQEQFAPILSVYPSSLALLKHWETNSLSERCPERKTYSPKPTPKLSDCFQFQVFAAKCYKVVVISSTLESKLAFILLLQ